MADLANVSVRILIFGWHLDPSEQAVLRKQTTLASIRLYGIASRDHRRKRWIHFKLKYRRSSRLEFIIMNQGGRIN